jgi:hypothetical protein
VSATSDIWEELVEECWSRGMYPLIVEVKANSWEGSFYELEEGEPTGPQVVALGNGYGSCAVGVIGDMLRIIRSATDPD